MAASFNGASNSMDGYNTSLTWAHTINAGADRVLGVCVGPGSMTPTSVTYGGVALVLKTTRDSILTNRKLRYYELKAPAVGTANIVITMPGNTGIIGLALAFNDVLQSAEAIVAFATASYGVSPQSLAVSTPTGGIAGSFILDASQPTLEYAATGGGIKVQEALAGSFYAIASQYKENATSMGWSWAYGDRSLDHLAVSYASTAVVDTTPPDITAPGKGVQNGPFVADCAETSTAACITMTASESLSAVRKLSTGDGALFTLAGTGLNRTLAPTAAFDFELLPHANPFVVTLEWDDAATPPNTRTTVVSISITDIAELPGAPTIGTATAGSGGATFAAAAPNMTGKPPITKFMLTVSPGGAVFESSTLPITATGLTNGTAYTGTIAAANSDGTGPASAASNSVTPSAAFSQLSGTATLDELTASGGLGSTASPGVMTIPELRNWSNMLLASQTIAKLAVIRISDVTLMATFTNQATNASGHMVVTSGSLLAGVLVMAVGFNADGSERFARAVTIA